MEKLRDSLFSKFAAASIPVSSDLHRKINLRFRKLSTSFRVPDHPPYASMICEAIEKLVEDSGSTEEAISGFIVREHQNLALAHNLMLDHHLRRLCQSGEIVRRGGSDSPRYLLPGRAEKKHGEVKRRKRVGDENAREFGEDGSAEKRKGKGRNRTMRVLGVIGEANVGEVEERLLIEAAQREELPTRVPEGGVQEGGEVTMTECGSGEVFEGSDHGEEFGIQVQSQGVEAMTEMQTPSEEAKSSNEASMYIQANAGLSGVVEEHHEPQDQHVEVARKQMQLQEVQTKPSDKHFEAHGQENTMSEESKHEEHRIEVSETMQVSPVEDGGDRDDMSHFLERNEDESPMFPLQTLETRRTSCQDASCVIKLGNLKQVLQVIDEENIGEVEERQSTEAAQHKELPTAATQGGVQAQTQGVEITVTESQIGEIFEGCNRCEKFRIQVQNQGVDVMMEIQRLTEEAKSCNEASMDIQANAGLSEVAEEQHEPQDQHVEVQTKPNDKHFEAHGQDNTTSEEGTCQEHQTEVSETMQVSPAEGGGDRNDTVHFLERNEDASLMFQLQTPELVRQPGLHNTWTRKTSCLDASCVTERENLELEVVKSLRSQCHSALFGVEVQQLMNEMAKIKRDMQEVAPSEKQARVDEELLVLKKTYAKLLEKTRKVHKQLLEFSLSRVEMGISKNDATKTVLEKEKKYQDEEEKSQQQQIRSPYKERESVVYMISEQNHPQRPKLCCSAETNKSQVAHEQEQQPKFPNSVEPVQLELTTLEESSQTQDFFTPPMEKLAKTRDLQKQSAPQTTFHADLGAAMDTRELEKQVAVQFPDKPPELNKNNLGQRQGMQLRPRGVVSSKPEQATANTKLKASTSLSASQSKQGKLSCRGRGRPPKRKLYASADHEMQLPKRGRGRPSRLLNPDAIANIVRCPHKNDQQPSAESADTSNELLSCKDNQGRNQQPEQATANAVINTSTSLSPQQNVQEQPRGRGRPRKQVILHVRDVESDSSMPRTKKLLQSWGKLND